MVVYITLICFVLSIGLNSLVSVFIFIVFCLIDLQIVEYITVSQYEETK